MKNSNNPCSAKTLGCALAVVMLMILGGCGGGNYVWYHKDNDRAAFMKDNLQCQEESAQYAKFLDKRGDKDVIGDRMKECMGLRGYVKVLEEDLPAGAKRF